MPTGLLTSQVFTEFSTILILALTVGLAVVLTRAYAKSKARSHLFWSIGLWLFALSVLLEVLFAFGVYSGFMIGMYLFLVVALVESLAMGAVALYKSRKLEMYFGAFAIASLAFAAYSIATSTIGNVLTNHVVFGVLPIMIITASSIGTFPSAVALIAIAAISYRKKKNPKMLSIISGVVIVSAAGTLYISGFPSFLYYSEFVGILLLWLGFV